MLNWLLPFFRRRRAERELAQEMEEHISEAMAELQRSGMPAQEAYYTARKQFGNLTAVKEQSGEVWSWGLLEILLWDFRYALRQLGGSPAFALTVIATLATAIGANTAIFSVVNSTLLQPLPFVDSSRLLTLWTGDEQGYPWYTFSYPRYRYFAERSRNFADVAAYDDEIVTLADRGQPVRLEGGRVSANFFSVLGVKPALGRTFSSDEDRHGAPAVALLSDQLWRKRYHADPRIIGHTVRIDNDESTIIGVLPAGFQFLGVPVEVWRSRVIDTRTFAPASVNLGAQYLTITARLHPGLTMQEAQARLAAIDAEYRSDNRSNSDISSLGHAQFLQQKMFGPIRTTLFLLWASVICLLAIACANISSLMLARATGRHREMSVRMALGASPWRVAQQVMTESIILAACGGLLSLPITYLGMGRLAFALRQTAHGVPAVHFDVAITFFTFAVTGLIAIVLGLIPILMYLRSGVQAGLRSGERGFSGSKWSTQVRGSIVAGQIALCFVLLAAAALLIQSFVRMSTLATGVRPEHVMIFPLDLMPSRYQKWGTRVTFYDDVLRRVRDLYGVNGAAIASKVNLVSSGLGYLVQVEGSADLGPRNPGAEGRSITSDYFYVAGIPLLSGRAFTEHDTSSSERVMIVNQAFARKFFPEQNPLGKHVTYSTDRITCEVVGVVRNVRASISETNADPEVYLPLSQRPWLVAKLLVRTEKPAAITSAVRQQIEVADPNQAVAESLPMEQVINNDLSRPRVVMLVVVVFGAAALLLSATGIFGVVAYTVAQRRKEIGIRLALGADARRVRMLVFRQTFRLLLIGFACGLPLSLVLGPLYASLLFGVRPSDPATLFAGVIVLSFVALTASYIPARRASKLDPATVLRAE